MESVILTSPVIIIGFIIAFALEIYALAKRANAAVTLTAAAIFIFTVAYALLNGADLYETGAVAAVFFIVGLLPLWRKGGDK